MSSWNKIKLLTIMSIAVLLSLLLIFSTLKLMFMQDGSLGRGFGLLAAMVGTALCIDLITSPIYLTAYQQFKLPTGHDWDMMNKKNRNHGYYCKECNVKVMFDWSGRKYVESVLLQVSDVNSKALLFPMTLKDVRSCEEIKMDNALG